MTGQIVIKGHRIDRRVSRQTSWSASPSSKMATIGPVSTSTATSFFMAGSDGLLHVLAAVTRQVSLAAAEAANQIFHQVPGIHIRLRKHAPAVVPNRPADYVGAGHIQLPRRLCNHSIKLSIEPNANRHTPKPPYVLQSVI